MFIKHIVLGVTHVIFKHQRKIVAHAFYIQNYVYNYLSHLQLNGIGKVPEQFKDGFLQQYYQIVNPAQ